MLIAAHGNSLRSIIKQLENLSEEEIVNIQLGTGVLIIYGIDADSQVTEEVILN